ncbi:cutinase-domain-containing protein [Clohesyomyces aquaticus]|uniref:Cutinase n=1 Tax=Clohesyomyces aquaticus TaxID=1231657 RepID=A0A1Y1ZCP8_9PLEO|nr:cutinase-domain-containing protein [Clohesyomyces aquaticus]
MHYQSFILAALVSLAASSPIEKRQTGSTSKEFSQGGCRDIIFAFARGSTEIGNMGTVVGPPTSNALKKTFGASKVATEGVDYAADLLPNTLPGGTDKQSAAAMAKILNDAASQCPNSVIVAGGYSQGAAVTHRAIENLDQSVKDQIAGVVTYGDTQKVQDKNQIPNFPADKLKIICATGDLVCVGTLTITPAHLSYGANANEGAQFLAQKIQGAQAAIKARQIKRNFEEQSKRALEALENEGAAA